MSRQRGKCRKRKNGLNRGKIKQNRRKMKQQNRRRRRSPRQNSRENVNMEFSTIILFLPLIFCYKIAALSRLPYYVIIRNTPSGVMHIQKGHRLHDRKIFLQEQHSLIINNPKIGKLSYSRRMVFSFKERRLTRVEAG